VRFDTRVKIHNIVALPYPVRARISTQNILLSLLCTPHSVSASAAMHVQNKSVRFLILLLREVGPPPTQRIIRPERPVPVRLFYLSVSKIRPPVLWCPSRTILYIITTPAIVLRPYLNAPCTRRVHRHPNIMVRDFRTPAVPSSVRSGHVLRRPRHVPSGSSPTGRLVHNIRTTPPPTQMPE